MAVVSRVWRSVVLCVWITVCLWDSQISRCQGSCRARSTCTLNSMAPCYYCNITYNHSNNWRFNDFADDLLRMAYFPGLTELLFDMHKSPQDDGASSFDWVIQSNDYMYYLPNWTASIHAFPLLERLDVHIPLRKIDAGLFKHMKHLKYMNLSHTLGLKSSDISQVLQALSNAGAPVEQLDLSWSRCFPDLPWDILSIRDHILKHLATFPLKVLDMRGIEFLEVDVGFAEFTPGLENVYLGDYQIPVKNREMEYCIWLDISILPNITEVVFDLGPWNINPHDLPCRGAWQEINLATSMNIVNGTVPHCSELYDYDACRLSRCECYNKINNYPLLRDYIQNLRYGDSNVGDTCDSDGVRDSVSFPPFPVPPKLRYLSISPVVLQEGVSERQHNISLRHLRYRLHAGNNYHNVYLVSELKHLKELHLQIGKIYAMESISSLWNACNMPELEVLDLGLTQIENFVTYDYRDAFAGCPNVRHLNLSECGIESLLFLNLTKLQSLDLSRNHLRVLKRRATDFLDSRAVQGGLDLYLSHNDLDCDCGNRAFFRWMNTTKVSFADKLDIRCYHRRLGIFNPWNLHVNPVQVRYCSDFHLILTATLSSSGSICLVLVVLLIVRKRWTIKYWLHAARTSWRTKQKPNAGSRGDYRYSAFVAYCSQDEEERKWVHLTLAPKLEQEYGFKLCMHHRDFMPGYDIADNIVESIHDSNKVLLILSPTFLESDWCQFEVRMAREKLIQDRRDSLVLVIYKPLDVPGVRLPRKLIRILEKKTYVEWTTDNVGQDLFWEKLSRALTDETRHEPYDVDFANVAPSDTEETDQLLMA